MVFFCLPAQSYLKLVTFHRWKKIHIFQKNIKTKGNRGDTQMITTHDDSHDGLLSTPGNEHAPHRGRGPGPWDWSNGDGAAGPTAPPPCGGSHPPFPF